MMSGNLVRFPAPSSSLVVDSWPLMEWLKDREPAAHRVQSIIEAASRLEVQLWMSTINLGEVLYLTVREWGAEAAKYFERVQRLPINFVPATDERVLAAARLKSVHSISYADAFAADLAVQRSCPVLTGDPDFQRLKAAGVLRLDWIGA